MCKQKNSKIEKNMESIMTFFEGFSCSKKIYKGHDRNVLCLPFYKVVFSKNIV